MRCHFVCPSTRANRHLFAYSIYTIGSIYRLHEQTIFILNKIFNFIFTFTHSVSISPSLHLSFSSNFSFSFILHIALFIVSFFRRLKSNRREQNREKCERTKLKKENNYQINELQTHTTHFVHLLNVSTRRHQMMRKFVDDELMTMRVYNKRPSEQEKKRRQNFYFLPLAST